VLFVGFDEVSAHVVGDGPAEQDSLFTSIIAAAMCDAHAASAMHGFYDTRIAEWVPCVQQAIERGEVPQGTDTHKVIRAVSAPLYYHLLVTGDSIDETMADQAAQAAQAAVIAARAGVYMRPGNS